MFQWRGLIIIEERTLCVYFKTIYKKHSVKGEILANTIREGQHGYWLGLETSNGVQSVAYNHIILKRLAKALYRLRVCAG